MSFRCLPATVDDMQSVNVQAAQIGMDGSSSILSTEAYSPELLQHFSRALLQDEVPIAVFGVTPIWPRYVIGWALLGDEALRVPKELTRRARSLIDLAQRALMLRRLQISVDTTHTAALRWAEHLGFNLEGRMKFYGPDGADHYLLARTWT